MLHSDSDSDKLPISTALGGRRQSALAGGQESRQPAQVARRGSAPPPVHPPVFNEESLPHPQGVERHGFLEMIRTGRRVSPPIGDLLGPRGTSGSGQEEAGEVRSGRRHGKDPQVEESSGSSSNGFGRGFEQDFRRPYSGSDDDQDSEPLVRHQRTSPGETGNHSESSGTFQNLGDNIHAGPSTGPRTTHSLGEFVPTSIDPIILDLFKDDFSELEAAVDPRGSVRERQDALHQEAAQQQPDQIPEGGASQRGDGSEAGSSTPKGDDVGSRAIVPRDPTNIGDDAESPGEGGSTAPQHQQQQPQHQSPSDYSDSQCREEAPSPIPAAMKPFLSYRVYGNNLSTLEAVHQTHPETFVNIRARSALGGGMLLDRLADVLDSLRHIPLKKFGETSLQDAKGALLDLQNMGGLEVGWLISHMERMYSSRRAFKFPLRVEAKRREINQARERVDMTRNLLVQREADLRDREAELEVLLREKAEYEAAGGEIFGRDDPVTKGLFPDPPP